MNHKGFWELIDVVNQEAEPWNRDSILLTTQERLLELPLPEIIDFHNYLKWYIGAADTPSLVAAAVAINDGTSDDGFNDFRAWLVSQGQEVYRKALKCADSLAELDIPQEDYYPRKALCRGNHRAEEYPGGTGSADHGSDAGKPVCWVPAG